MKPIHILSILIAVLISNLAVADVMQDVKNLQQRWAEVNYSLKDKKQAFEALIVEADKVVANNPDSAEVLIWRGIINSSFAGVKGGLGALSFAKTAKADFETAMMIDANALSGSAYTSLGTLYFKVPGWPFGFGDDDKAKDLLEKAININPDGIDSNYFYADFLADQRHYKQAEQFLLKAQQAPARATRPMADKGRHAEIDVALINVRNQLSRQNSASITDRR
jgi:tetratricopeptide (TPR) repeat protein